MAGSWELAVSYGHRRYPDQTTHRAGLGIGKYVGNWYLRAKSTLAPYAGTVNMTQSLRARRYLDSPRAYVGVQIGFGRGAEIVGEGPVVQATRTYFAIVQAQKFILPHVGVSATAAYSNDDFFTRQGLTVGLLTRW